MNRPHDAREGRGGSRTSAPTTPADDNSAFERELADLIAWAEKAQSFGPGDFVKLHRLAFLAKTAAK